MFISVLSELLTVDEKTGLEYGMELRNAGLPMDEVEQMLRSAGYTVHRERFLDLYALRILEPEEEISRYRGNADELVIWNYPEWTNYQA